VLGAQTNLAPGDRSLRRTDRVSCILIGSDRGAQSTPAYDHRHHPEVRVSAGTYNDGYVDNVSFCLLLPAGRGWLPLTPAR